MTCHRTQCRNFVFNTELWREGPALSSVTVAWREEEHIISALAMVIHRGDELHYKNGLI